MTWLVYVRGLRRPEPQIVYDGADKPLLSEGMKGCVLAHHRLSDDERRLSFADLAKRYPPPGANDDGKAAPDDPVPPSPAPISPSLTGGAVAAMEAA